ncbi:hypothetical protein BJY52DRAFT_1151868 [Lactarius psammicola]|nr:hypothetical protein BJY52DRAFT_1151868 [Lactarius psammicola]
MTDIIVQVMAEVLSILGIVTKEIGDGRTKKYFKKLVGWTGASVEDAVQSLDRLTKEEASMAAAELLKITRGIDNRVEGVQENLEGVDQRIQIVDLKVQGIDGKMQGIEDKLQDVGDKVSSVLEGEKETRVAIEQVANQVINLNRNELRDLRKWISAPDPSTNYLTAREAHHEGTATWCTQSSTFANWKASGPLLWIHGKPGSGKSVVSSVIIREIKAMCDAGSAHMAYFYFDFQVTGKQDSRALLSSLLLQLSSQSDQFGGVLHGLYSKHQNGSERPTTESLAQCLEDMLSIAGQVPIYLVLDALDECPTDSGMPTPREKVLDLIEELVELRHPNLHLCVTSRQEYDIRTVLEPLATQQVSLHNESGQKQDIIDYVGSVIRSDKKMKKWPVKDQNMVIEKLAEKADGM